MHFQDVEKKTIEKAHTMAFLPWTTETEKKFSFLTNVNFLPNVNFLTNVNYLTNVNET